MPDTQADTSIDSFPLWTPFSQILRCPPNRVNSIGPLKNKQQLIQALEKAAGEELAEQATQDALEAAKKEALKKAADALGQATAKVVVPESPAGYANFLSAVKDAEAALTGGAGLPKELLESKAKEILLKKQLFHDQVAALKASQLKTLAKETQLKH